MGASLALDGSADPSGNGTILYRSNDESICTVAADGAVTGVSVGDCEVSFRDSGDSSNAATPWSAVLAIEVIQGTIPDLSGDNVYGSSKLPIGGSLELEEDLSGYGTAEFSVVASDNCAVDAQSGVVTPTADAADSDTCTIQATFSGNDNYAAQETAADLATITVGPGSQIITFIDPYGAAPNVGIDGTLALASAPTSDQGGTISYRDKERDQSICEVAADGTVTANSLGECIVEAKAAAVTNYDASEWVEIATIEVGMGTLALTWNPPSEGRVGTDLDMTAATGSTSATIVYSVEDAGDTGCAFKGTSGAAGRTLVFESWGLCQVRATASAADYNEWVRDHYVRVRPGAISATVADFNSSDKLKVGVRTSKVPGDYSNKSPMDADFAWELVRGEKDCELVSADTGAVRARAVSFEGGTPECSIRLVGRKRNYETFRSDPVSIPLEEGDLGDVSVKYGTGVEASLPLGGYVDITHLSEANALYARGGQKYLGERAEDSRNRSHRHLCG